MSHRIFRLAPVAALVAGLALAIPVAHAATTTTITVNGTAGRRTFDGVGAISGGNYWVQNSIDYLISWLDCAKSHGLTITYLGGRNEKGHNKTWSENLRAALNAHGYSAVKVVSDDSVGWKVADDMVADSAFKN